MRRRKRQVRFVKGEARAIGNKRWWVVLEVREVIEWHRCTGAKHTLRTACENLLGSLGVSQFSAGGKSTPARSQGYLEHGGDGVASTYGPTCIPGWEQVDSRQERMAFPCGGVARLTDRIRCL